MNFQDKQVLINKAATYTPAQKEIMRQVYHLSWDDIKRLPYEQQQTAFYYKSELEKFPPEFLKEQEFLSHPQVRQAQVQQSNFEDQKLLQHTQWGRAAVASSVNAPNRLALGGQQVTYNTTQTPVVNKAGVTQQDTQMPHFTYKGKPLYKADVAELGDGRIGLKYTLANRSNCVSGQRLYIKKGDKYKEIGRVEEAEKSQKSEGIQAPTLPISPITGQPSQFTQVVRRSLGLDAPQATNVTRQATSGLQVPQLSQKSETQQGLVSPEHYNRLAVYRSMYGQQPQTMGEYLQRCNEAAFAQKAHAAQIAARTVRVDLNYQ